MSTKLERQREYRLLRERAQELREKVEPIKHSRRMARLSAEVKRLENFLECSGEKSLPIKPFPECSREVTHPFHSNCGSGLCHAEGCICAMCFGECLLCRCQYCRNDIYDNCIFLAKNLPIKTEPTHSNAQVMDGVGDFLDQIDNFPGALEKALQDARAKKALDDYKSSQQILTSPHHDNCGCEICRYVPSHDDGVIPDGIFLFGQRLIPHLYNCGCEDCQNEEPIKSNKRNQKTPLEIAPAVSEHINNTEHLNGECGNPEGCDYCISVG